MEGNDCYKFSTVCSYIERVGVNPIRVAIDIGANVGEVTVLMRSYFPDAQIFAFEPVYEYYLRASQAVQLDPDTKVFNLAVTAAHLYDDDLGVSRRDRPEALKILKGLPAAGAGYVGGSWVVGSHTVNKNPAAYEELRENVVPITLDDLVSAVLALSGAEEVDYVKMDCEGCEHSALGAVAVETLQKIRFIGGEYHGVRRMYNTMHNRLFATHDVSLIGDSELGAFFCERKGNGATILEPDRAGMLIDRPWLCSSPIDWHRFREEFVLPDERLAHALPV